MLIQVLNQAAIAILHILSYLLIAMDMKAPLVDSHPLVVMDHVISHQEQESVVKGKWYNQQQVKNTILSIVCVIKVLINKVPCI